MAIFPRMKSNIRSGINMYYIKLNDQVSLKRYTKKEAEAKAQYYRETFKGVDVQIVDEKYVRKGKEK